jgi:hypothetical protein
MILPLSSGITVQCIVCAFTNQAISPGILRRDNSVDTLEQDIVVELFISSRGGDLFDCMHDDLEILLAR